MKKIWLLWIGIGLCYAASAQSVHTYTTKSKKAIKYYEQSTNFFIRRQYGPRLELLEITPLRKTRTLPKPSCGWVKSTYAINNEDQAKVHLKKAVKEKYDDPRFTDAHLLLANLYFGDGEYEEAQQLVQHLLKIPRLPKVIKDDARNLLANVEYTKQEIDNPLPYRPEPVGGEVNRFPLQYFPVLTVDQQTLIFTGRRGTTPQYDEDIYVSEKSEEGTWLAPRPLSESITTPRNEGTCTVSADGRTLIFTACEDRTVWAVAICTSPAKPATAGHVPRTWGVISTAGRGNRNPRCRPTGARSTSSLTGRVRDGRRDIYVAQRQDDGEWAPARNLGGEVNTPRDEVSPFIHVNGQTLYFASNGRPGFGGFDLYVTELAMKQWSPPKT